MSRYYVTTSIPYVNARPHVGFALELVQADVIARYRRLLGNPTRLQTGADENAFKNVLAAREQGISPEELVERNSETFRKLAQALHISYDDFLRTTEARHRRAVAEFWRRLAPGDIYVKPYRGFYCDGCEDFLLERDLADGRCPDHDRPPVEVREENYFFRLSAYQEKIEQLLVSGQLRITPESRKNEILAFLRAGLQDISISRAAARAEGWGIPVPGDPGQVVYVWIDALINYLSGPGFGEEADWRRYWGAETTKIHVIGKNVWKFHVIYWPALLLSAQLPLPDEIVIHGFLTENGRKISKSRGNTIDPFSCIAEFGAEAVRYYLFRSVSPFADGDFSLARLKQTYNSDLANNLGNLVSRLTTLCAKAGYGGACAPCVPAAPEGYHAALAGYEFDRALKLVWGLLDETNRAIERVEPWSLLKHGKRADLAEHLCKWLAQLHRAAYWLAPFLPATSAKILQIIAEEPIVPAEALFPRLP